jgi:hypothetical protein
MKLDPRLKIHSRSKNVQQKKWKTRQVDAAWLLKMIKKKYSLKRRLLNYKRLKLSWIFL